MVQGVKALLYRAFTLHLLTLKLSEGRNFFYSKLPRKAKHLINIRVLLFLLTPIYQHQPNDNSYELTFYWWRSWEGVRLFESKAYLSKSPTRSSLDYSDVSPVSGRLNL